MKATRLGTRLAGTAAATLVLGAGVLATAPSAAAKANVLNINKVSLHKPGIAVKVTYSCDRGIHHRLMANAVAREGHRNAVRAAGAVKGAKLTCDFKDHTLTVNLRPKTGHFAKGDKAKVTVFYLDNKGHKYAIRSKVAAL